MLTALEFASGATELHSRLARAVFATCGRWDLAEDSAQEALLRAWQHLDRGGELRSLEAWTMSVALNWCRSQLRRGGAEERAMVRLASRHRITVGPECSSEVTTRQLGEDVHRAVLDLPERQREVIVLRYLLDMDVDSIAEVLGRSEGAIKNALFHGRSALARKLSDSATPRDGEGIGGGALDVGHR